MGEDTFAPLPPFVCAAPGGTDTVEGTRCGLGIEALLFLFSLALLLLRGLPLAFALGGMGALLLGLLCGQRGGGLGLLGLLGLVELHSAQPFGGEVAGEGDPACLAQGGLLGFSQQGRREQVVCLAGAKGSQDGLPPDALHAAAQGNRRGGQPLG